MKNIDDLREAWLRHLTLRGYSHHTKSAYESDWRDFCAFLLRYTQDNITIELVALLSVTQLRSWLADRLGRGICHRSNARAVSVLRSVYKFMSQNNIVHSRAIDILKTPKIPKLLPRPIDKDILLSFFDHSIHNDSNDEHTCQTDSAMVLCNSADDDWIALRNKALFALLYGSGLRISEALSLNQRYIMENPEKSYTIKVLGKGKKERVVPIFVPVSKLTQAYLDAQPYGKGAKYPLFWGQKGKRLHPSVAKKAISEIGDSLGVHISAHQLRHSCASHVFKNGADLRSIQILLGHKSLSSTQIYVNVDDQMLSEEYIKSHPLMKMISKTP